MWSITASMMCGLRFLVRAEEKVCGKKVVHGMGIIPFIDAIMTRNGGFHAEMTPSYSSSLFSRAPRLVCLGLPFCVFLFNTTKDIVYSNII